MRLPKLHTKVRASDGRQELEAVITRVFTLKKPKHGLNVGDTDPLNVSIELPDGTVHDSVHLFASRAEAEAFQQEREPGTYTILAFWPD